MRRVSAKYYSYRLRTTSKKLRYNDNVQRAKYHSEYMENRQKCLELRKVAN